VSCGRPDLNVESEIADAIGELGWGTGWVATGEMVDAEVLIASTVSQHVVSGGQDRCCDGNRLEQSQGYRLIHVARHEMCTGVPNAAEDRKPWPER